MPIPCARCAMPLPAWEIAAHSQGSVTAAVCKMCGAANTARAFPALLAQRTVPQPEAALEGEAACFDHPAKRAVAACQQCGRFVCQLCAVDLSGSTLCPSCVAAGAGRARAANPDSSRTLYDSIALTLPLATLIIWPFTIAGAPASLALSIAKWRKPLSIVRRNRWRFVAAILVSLAEIVLWGLALFAFFLGLRAARTVPPR